MIETLLLILFAAAAVAGAVLMLLLRHPMRVALALIASMISLGGIYGLLGVHVIAVFQIMIYVGAVMVFMVYAIMLLDVRDPSFTERYSRLLWPGLAAVAVLVGVLVSAVWPVTDAASAASADSGTLFGVQAFSAAFLGEYWLYFELTSVLLVVAVLAAVAIVKLRKPAATPPAPSTQGTQGAGHG